MANRNNATAAAVHDPDALFSEYSESRSTELRNEIVKRNIYLAEIISRKFLNRGVDYEDIYQVACLALIKAVERFDRNVGVKFSSYATPSIIGEIKRYFRDKSSAIRIPRRIYELYQKVDHAREELLQQLQRVPRADEIASHLNMKEETVLETLESWNTYSMQSLDQNAYEDDDVELHETIGQTDGTFEIIENRDFIKKAFDRFNEAEKRFIQLRYYSRKTQKEIADDFGVSQMYISRLEKKVLDKFRSMIGK